MLSLVTVQMINANSCKWTSTIPFNIPASWSCDDIINQTVTMHMTNVYTHTHVGIPTIKYGDHYVIDELQASSVIAKRKGGTLWIAPCKTGRKPFRTIEFTGGLLNKFEIERINAELELLSHHHDTDSLVSSQYKDDSIWEEIAEQGKELTNHVGQEVDQVIQFNQEELESVATNWKLITICISIAVILLIIIGLKFKLVFLQSLFCSSRRRNSDHKNIIILPTEPKLTQVSDKENQASVIRLNTFSYTPEDTPIRMLY
ncbi:Integrase core domain containing protein [Dirofilaria immitis]|nr:Integrase core domain containing protein [Dirofilaria immitis]